MRSGRQTLGGAFVGLALATAGGLALSAMAALAADQIHPAAAPVPAAAAASSAGPAEKSAAVAAQSPAPSAGIAALKPGAKVMVGAAEVIVKEVDVTPLARNEYSDLFVFDSYENPKLAELRQKYELEKVVAPGKDEFDKQVLLLDWTYRQFKKFGTPTAKAKGALEILKAVEEGHTFFCAHYATTLVSAAASLGWIDRSLGLKSAATKGAPEHSVTEIWSNQYRKWVMFDPTYAVYVEQDGRPLSAWELRQDWLYNDGRNLTFVVGAARKKYKKADMPIFLATHKGYGDLALKPTTLDKYLLIAYVPNTNLMDAPEDYGRMFISKDAKADGVKWHKRKNPADPAREPYFPLNQSALTLTPASPATPASSAAATTSTSPATALTAPGAKGGAVATLAVKVETMTPNLAGYRYRFDGAAEWQPGEPRLWPLHKGTNTLEVVTTNKFGVDGVPSKVVLEVK